MVDVEKSSERLEEVRRNMRHRGAGRREFPWGLTGGRWDRTAEE